MLLLYGLGLFPCLPLFSESGKWVIAAQKFEIASGTENNTVNDKTSELLPADILEKIGDTIIRNVLPDEQFERSKYKLRTERQSLFLQLSAEYKKRDSLVLANYSDYKLKTAIKESEKKIKEIQKKIDTNLEGLKTATEENERKMAEISEGNVESETDDSELSRYRNLFRKMFVKDESLIQQEQLAFYNNDASRLYTPSSDLKELEVTDALYEKAVVSAGINTLLTGTFSKYGDYMSVYVDVYNYPGVKKIGSATEVGTVQELELITNSIAMQIVPFLANSLPVRLEVTMEPVEAVRNSAIYIDGDLQDLRDGEIIIGSGIHTIQFTSDGYKTAETTYSFEGNKAYKIEVNFEKPKSGFLQVGLKKPIEGNLIMNGERALEIEPHKSQIAINGKQILGEFITENGETSFFYVPKKLTFDGSYVVINPKPMDRMAYIEKRRKIMYTSYSIFVISLIPTFYTYANYNNNVNLYVNEQVDYTTAKNWQTATNITRGITIGCAVFWVYELVRYLVAANSVLPQNAKAGKIELPEIQIINNDETNQNEEINETTDGETE